MSGKCVAAAILWLASSTTLGAQAAPATSAPITAVTYTVTADRAALASRRLAVVMSFDVADNAPVLLSLPAWTPGAYEISNFARWVSGFRPDEGGTELRWDKLDYDTWRLHPTHPGRVTVNFTYAADTLDNAMAWTRPDFALFNGTNVFMYPEGRSLDFTSTVTIRTDADFRIATGLPSNGTKDSFRAANYHELVDMPVFVGRFDLDSTFISGKPVRLATYPVGSVSGQMRATTWEQLKRVIPVEVSVFGEAPWSNYTVMQIADSTTPGYSGLEHASSHVDIVAAQGLGADLLPSLYAHEIFHSWNVKRLRPADMMPYRYDRPQPTIWLWVSEGITDYYADLAEVRGGVVDAGGFYALTAAKIDEIAHTVPFSLDDASLNTWIHPQDGTGYSYYPKGSLAGLMLDILIRDGSSNKRSLDAVMRELYEATYKKGRGFTHDDFWGAVNRAAGSRSIDDFEQKYVAGREAYPWPAMLKMAGMRMMPDSTPRIGVSSGVDPAGNVRVLELEVGGAAALAGVKVGDEMLKVGDIAVSDADFGAKFRLQYAGRPAGSPLPLTVKRGAETLTLRGALAYASSAPKIGEDPAASAKATRIRNGILRGSTDR
ncbi:PDZ domain-containing protein [soil metagenome]